jgi:hypothetical protein
METLRRPLEEVSGPGGPENRLGAEAGAATRA